MKKSYYVLMERCFQFTDDNKYYRDQSNGGNPSKVFFFKTKANEVARQNNLENFQRIIRDSSVKEYGYSLDELISSKTLEDDLLFEEGIFMTVFGQTADEWWQSLSNLKWGQRLSLKMEPTPEQWGKLYDCFNLSFWEVVEVEEG